MLICSVLVAAAILFCFIAAYFCEKFRSPDGRGGMPPGRTDALIMGALCLGYALVVFWNLGILRAPATEYTLLAGESIVFDLGEDPGAEELYFYLMDVDSITVSIENRNSEGEEWICAHEATMGRAFSWSSCELSSSGRYFRLTNCSYDTAVAELVLLNGDGEIVTPVNAASTEALFDEAELFPGETGAQTGACFDEYLYESTAYDFLNGTKAREATHPPLGKILIAIGASIFGTSPFGFRFMSALFGTLMLPFLYLLAGNLSGSRKCGAFAAFLFAVDFMHFTQSRVAAPDVFVTFFVILMYYFMYHYIRLSVLEASRPYPAQGVRKGTLYLPAGQPLLALAACGVSFGLGIACKWSAAYAGLGLALLFFGTIACCARRMEVSPRYARRQDDSSMRVRRGFWGRTAITLGFCVLFFIVVPLLLYVLSYLPFSDGSGAGLLARMWENQKFIFQYHTQLDGEHVSASVWYEWPLMLKPLLYYSKTVSQTLREGASMFGNPLVWWGGIPAFFYMLCLWLRKKDRNAGFLCIAYLSCYLPWAFVGRYTFIYHYFPCVPFVACMIMYSFSGWRARIGERKFTVLLFLCGGTALLLLVLFYPVLTGLPVSKVWVETFLEWLDGWRLVL